MCAALLSPYADVSVFERNEKAGKKIYITGKGRCNITNDLSPREFLQSLVRGGKFMQSAIYRFSPQDTMEFFENNGLRLKTERGNRVFPVSDKASDVTKTLVSVAERGGARIIYNSYIGGISRERDGYRLKGAESAGVFDTVVFANGGASYSATGSDGNGWAALRRLGHTIIEPRPSLVPFRVKENVREIEGLSLKNVTLTVKGSRSQRSEFGEMLFTDEGISGPIALTLSAYFNRDDKPLTLSVDLKPALSPEKLDERILSDFAKFANKEFKNSLNELLPKSLINYIISRSGIAPEQKVNLITKAQRASLLAVLKNLTFTVDGLGDLSRAVVTSGGVDLKEINPKTMESKIADGVYVIGELLDVDALTGGFNLQIAWSTAAACAAAIAEKEAL